jgi:hypothetical protein
MVQMRNPHSITMSQAAIMKGDSMPEIKIRFAFTIALEIHVSSLGDTIRRDDAMEVDVRLILETDDDHKI